MKGIVDMRDVSSIDNFTGEDCKWNAFAEDFEVAVSNIGLDDLMKQSLSVAESAVAWDTLDEDKRVQAKALYILLGAKLKDGRARNIYKGVPRIDGSWLGGF